MVDSWNEIPARIHRDVTTRMRSSTGESFATHEVNWFMGRDGYQPVLAIYDEYLANHLIIYDQI